MSDVKDRKWINQLEPGTEVEESYAVRSREIRKRRGGGDYLALVLSDRSGEVAGLAWESVEHIARACEVGSVVRVRGQVQRYNNRLQLVLTRAAVVATEDVDQRLFVKASAVDPDILWRRLMTLVEEVTDKDLKQLLFRIFADPEIEQSFRIAPAARSMHHAFRSGLLEHTVSMATAARSLARHYDLSQSLVVAACLLHDLGKVWELDLGSSIEYTDDGRLIGHLSMEVLYVDKRINELDAFPAETRRQLLHILLAHHGEYAYGSPRRPKTPEALLVHMVDNLDSKMAGMLEAISGDGDPENPWSQYSRILERHIYRRRIDEEL